MKNILLIILMSASTLCSAQEISAAELLKKSIAFHDPNNNWNTFKGRFRVVMQTPDRPERNSQISIDLPREVFILEVNQDSNSYAYVIEKDSCNLSFNGKTDLTEEVISKYRLSCERGSMYKDYYTYLYGLPMKLNDPGTQLAQKVEKKTFKGKEYLVLKATYRADVGDDIWYFYFDPKTYAMEVYQFYHDESKNDGEYILLSKLENINGIKMPKTRAWYYNKDDKYLGTDVLHATD
ncbi:DUF6503 family protein [uncultured Croceitalea sp.]|uniref:DUF6503 family protein n=1 Tax=uncultured Croceitalea sp. TaxID=1798908 RepID=UPI003305DD61